MKDSLRGCLKNPFYCKWLQLSLALSPRKKNLNVSMGTPTDILSLNPRHSQLRSFSSTKGLLRQPLIAIVLAILSLLNDRAFSQEEVGLSVDMTSRFKNDNEQSKLQSFVRFKINVKEGALELVAIGQTGQSFNDRYFVWYDSKADTPSGNDTESEFYLPQLYLQYHSENFVVALGALGTREDREGTVTSLYSSGFIDGGRVSIGGGEANWKVTATLGSIDEATVTRPNFFQRDLDLGSYAETVIQLQPSENTQLELGYESVNGEHYYSGVLSYEFNQQTNIVLEDIYNQENAAFHAGITVNHAFTDGLDSPEVVYNWIHQQMEYINFRWMNMIDDGLIARPGTSSITKFTIPVKSMDVYVRWRYHHDNPRWHRYEAGVSWGGHRRLK